MGFNYTVDVYERFKGRKDLLSPTQMSVLLALAYTANNKTGACYPGKGHLQALTLFGQTAVDKACADLEEKGLIGIQSRRLNARYNMSNSYSFLTANWPKRPSYEPIDDVDDDAESPRTVTTPCAPTHLPHELTETPSSGDRELPRYATPNREQLTKIKPRTNNVSWSSAMTDGDVPEKPIGGYYDLRTRLK